MGDKTAVVAVGGNAILRKGEEATLETQIRNLYHASLYIARMVRSGYNIALTHGNGPQVGDIVLQNEAAKEDVPPMPLDVCVAESQGLIGYMFQQAMTEALKATCCERTVPCVLTRVLVDPQDEAFRKPSKPIGPYYSEDAAKELILTEGWTFREDCARGGWRRVVPSPRPKRIIEAASIKRLITGGSDLVISAGGGGIPVVEKNGRLVGVEAVVDKDLAASCLATSMGESLLIMLTDVDNAYLDFGTPDQRPIRGMSVEAAEQYLRDGQFPAGSMGPKVEAGVEFVRSGGERAIITRPELLDMALASKAGTQIHLR
jgi:carbamate kinase